MNLNENPNFKNFVESKGEEVLQFLATDEGLSHKELEA